MAKTKKQLLADAKRHLKHKFIQGSWVKFLKDDPSWEGGKLLEDYWRPGYHSFDHLKDLLKSRANPDCYVCAEGAVYLACALADEDEETALELIAALNETVQATSPSSHTRDVGIGVMHINDSTEIDNPKEQVLAVFELTEETIDG